MVNENTVSGEYLVTEMACMGADARGNHLRQKWVSLPQGVSDFQPAVRQLRELRFGREGSKGQKVAIGFTNDPVPPAILTGARVRRKL
jgi:hypothetical protein